MPPIGWESTEIGATFTEGAPAEAECTSIGFLQCTWLLVGNVPSTQPAVIIDTTNAAILQQWR